MKSKYLFGGVITVVFLGLMVFLLTQTNISYESNFEVVKTKDRTVKATGSWVKEKSYQINNEERTFVFYMKDYQGHEMKVVFEGTIPNNFESAVSVVATGKYNGEYFHATDILTKCPSKYEDEKQISS